MKRIWGRVLTLVVATGALSAMTPGCADNDRTIFVQDVLAPSQTRTAGACSYTNDPTQPSISIGRQDVGLSDAYIAELLVGNQMISRGDPAAPRAESNRAHITGAVVHLADANGGTIADFTSLTNGFVDPSANNVPGYGAMTVPLTDAASSAALRNVLKTRGVSQTIVATVKVFGTTIGNVDVESGNFDFPIEVCNGCLVNYAAVNLPGMPNAGQCTAAPTDAELTSTNGPCSLGTDVGVSCTICRGARNPDICQFPPPL